MVLNLYLPTELGVKVAVTNVCIRKRLQFIVKLQGTFHMSGGNPCAGGYEDMFSLFSKRHHVVPTFGAKNNVSTVHKSMPFI